MKGVTELQLLGSAELGGVAELSGGPELDGGPELRWRSGVEVEVRSWGGGPGYGDAESWYTA